MTTNTPALLPVKMSAAMRRKMREFKGKTQLSATTKNGSRNTHPTIKALESRGLVKTKLTNTGRPFLIAELTEQGQAYMSAIVERTEVEPGPADKPTTEAGGVKVGACVEFYTADVLDGDDDATGRTQGVVNRIDERGALIVFTAGEETVRIMPGAVAVLEEPAEPDREQIARDLGKLAGLATATGSKAEEMVARQIARNERLAAEKR